MIGTIFIALGVFFIVVANIGIFRFPSFYTRLHAAGIADSCGAMLLLIGFALQNEFSLNTIKILLLILTIWIANSTNSYVLAHTYYKNEKGNGLLPKPVYDEKSLKKRNTQKSTSQKKSSSGHKKSNNKGDLNA